jgi:transposase
MSIWTSINWKKLLKTIFTVGLNYLTEYLKRRQAEKEEKKLKAAKATNETN